MKFTTGDQHLIARRKNYVAKRLLEMFRKDDKVLTDQRSLRDL